MYNIVIRTSDVSSVFIPRHFLRASSHILRILIIHSTMEPSDREEFNAVDLILPSDGKLIWQEWNILRECNANNDKDSHNKNTHR